MYEIIDIKKIILYCIVTLAIVIAMKLQINHLIALVVNLLTIVGLMMMMMMMSHQHIIDKTLLALVVFFTQ